MKCRVRWSAVSCKETQTNVKYCSKDGKGSERTILFANVKLMRNNEYLGLQQSTKSPIKVPELITKFLMNFNVTKVNLMKMGHTEGKVMTYLTCHKNTTSS